jgi:putative hydrolase of the HAD superfamily
MPDSKFQVLFSDIGGVLGTNGWDSQLRQKVIDRFGLDFDEVDKRHHLMFDSYERGFLSFEEYLKYVVFHIPRYFKLQELRDYVYAGSVAWQENIDLFARVKQANGLKLALISNEGQGITEHRIGKFGLRKLADYIVVSHCVHMRKPDAQMWKLALDLSQVTARECIYVDDRQMFVDVANDLGFTAFQHTSLESTRQKFKELGLKVE